MSEPTYEDMKKAVAQAKTPLAVQQSTALVLVDILRELAILRAETMRIANQLEFEE